MLSASIRFEGLIKTYPDYKKPEKVLLNLGLAYKKTGMKDKATEALKKIVDKFPTLPEAADAKKELVSLTSDKK